MSTSNLQARKTAIATSELLAPDAACWAQCPPVRLQLTATPIDRQPSAYVQRAWRDKAHGQVPEVQVQVQRNAESLAIRLSWDQERPSHGIDDVNAYADACAVLFPADGRTAELSTMGSEQTPVVGWHWRAGSDHPFTVTARGIGTVTRDATHRLRAAGRHGADRWAVVLLHPLQDASPALASAPSLPVAFAVWSGATGERAGLKSHTPQFHELRLQPSE